MTSIAQVPLDSELAESLREIANKQGQSLENVLDDLVRQYVREARREKIRRECRHYERMHPIDSVSLVGLYVVGDDMGDEVILGRDVLNKLPLFLDGPQTQTDILDNTVVERLRRRN